MELRIESLSSGGDGVARASDGRVVFVPFTAPGDRVRVRVFEQRPRYLRARVETLLEPGASRTDPACPAFGSCGGCSWQHVDVEVQREQKARIVADALQRIGGVPFGGEIRVEPSPGYGYRVRTRVNRQGGRTGYRRRRSHRIHPVDRCPVLDLRLDASLHELAASAGPDGEWELAAGGEGTRSAPVGEGGPIRIRVMDDVLRISPGVFFQSNGPLHDALARAVHDAAGSGETLVEAFAGAGFFTLGLARAFSRVVAVESHPAAAADLRHNLEAAGATRVEVLEAPLEQALGGLPRAEVVVLDPPRTGLARGAAEALSDLGAVRIVYLSCDPATLARDVSALVAGGYRLTGVRAFDLFPQTPHVEVLAVLEA